MVGSRTVVRPRDARASRPVRALRGTAGSVIAALFAAASHAAAGGEITWLAVLVTTTLALPLCVLLAGRVASLWRLTLAIGGAQFLYHWVFAGLGMGSSDSGAPAPLHAVHLATLQSLSPTATPEAAGAAMWGWHAVAAAFTIALVYRGERAAIAVLRLVRRAVAVPAQHAHTSPRPAIPRITTVAPLTALRDRLLSTAAITHRGPPLAA